MRRWSTSTFRLACRGSTSSTSTSRRGRARTWATPRRTNGARLRFGTRPPKLARLVSQTRSQPTNKGRVPAMAYEVPPLPYAFDALEPHIDAKTMEIHHDKHHAAYVNNANGALEKHPELAKKSVEDLLRGISSVPEDVRNVLRNNAGGHSNHSIFWTIMGPNGGGAPSGRLGDAIKSTFGSYDTLKEQLQKAAVGQFGSGWAWLLKDSGGTLLIKS